MKTIEEFIREIESSEELQNELKEINSKEAADEFLKKHDCGATAGEFGKALNARSEGALDDDLSESAAGGLDANTTFPAPTLPFNYPYFH
jgi:hypothetical protein